MSQPRINSSFIYNQAVNDYFDGRIGLKKLQEVAGEHGAGNLDIVTEISQRALKESEISRDLDTWSITKKKAYVHAQIGDCSPEIYHNSEKLNELVIDLKILESTQASKGARSSHGLPNLGNTCFGNASLRGILLSPALRELLTRDLPASASSDQKNLQDNLKALAEEMEKESPSQATVERLLTAIWKSPLLEEAGLRAMTRQEDAEQFLTTVLDALHFAGHATHAAQLGTTFSKESDGSDQVEGDKHPMAIIPAPIPSVAPTLQKSIDGFFAPEDIPLSESLTGRLLGYDRREHYLASTTHAGEAAAPPTLMVSLKKYSYDRVTKRPVKITTPITGFDQRIAVAVKDSTDTTVNAQYRVDRVVCHLGSSPQSGHYVALVREGDHWVKYNDSFTSTLTDEEAYAFMEEHAYIVHLSKVVSSSEAS